jgi:hypothetical protein
VCLDQASGLAGSASHNPNQTLWFGKTDLLPVNRTNDRAAKKWVQMGVLLGLIDDMDIPPTALKWM